MKPTILISWLVVLLGLPTSGCRAPIGADKVTTTQAYAQVQATALRTGKPSARTVAMLHRYDLDRLGTRQPDEVVRQLHPIAVATGDRDLLFGLAEMSYVAAEQIRRSLKSWDQRDERDYYLGAAVYAYLFLFGEGPEARPSAFDPRFRSACDFYNIGLGLALTDRGTTNAAVRLASGPRRLPTGGINLRLDLAHFPAPQEDFERLLLADQFRVRGLSVRNRDSGVGAPLLAVRRFDPELGVRRCTPATVLLRLSGSLADLDRGTGIGVLELYSAFDHATVVLGDSQVPLEIDLTTHAAYVLNQSFLWDLGMKQFLAPAQRVRSQLLPLDAFKPNRIPVVLVHGTFSSPVTWAELINALMADPVLRRHYQLWSFMYGSGNPLPISAGELRDALTAAVQQLDPDGQEPALRRMVVIGHSQGGLLTKLTAATTGNQLWHVFSTNRLEDLKINEADRDRLRHLLFLEPLPYVRRVVFISTPHHGSYLAGGFTRQLARKLMSLPATLVSRTSQALTLTKGSEVEKFLGGKMPTSLDSMSPKNPALLALAEIPVAPTIKAHSIIPVMGDGDFHEGRDGVVSYQSAHLEGVESELVVRGKHSCQNLPVTVEEVRRILLEHLHDPDLAGDASRHQPGPEPRHGNGARMTSNQSGAVP
jgi:pimeloyl-ACP methyl ester carboxylesterase